MIAYDYDTNAILVEAFINGQAASIITVWTTINKKNDAGVQPNTYILDNKCSGDLKTAFITTILFSNDSHHLAIV